MNSLKRLKGLGSRKHGDGRQSREARDRASSPAPLVRLDELAQASQEMQDMRDCYDSLLSAAAATANSAYEFSESLREMGSCLLEKTALNDDEESGKVLLMLGKVQFDLQKLVDSYRSHVTRTITNPSESLLNELRTVEEMKRQCDEKRDVYEYMIQRQKEKGRSRNGNVETFTKHQIQAAHEEYDEEATLFVFRMKSLKQGQSRSLLTQAARHHAAQLCFFKKALKSVEAVEPHVKWISEQEHIEYQFSGLEDEFSDNSEDDDEYEDYDDENDGRNEVDAHDAGELSFDYGQNDQEHDVVSTSQDSMELDQVDITFPHVSTAEASKHNADRGDRDPFSNKVLKLSMSAPLYAEKNPDIAERAREVQRTPRKFHSYVLPTPEDTKTPSPLPQTNHPWHSSPLEPKKHENNEKPSRQTVLNAQSLLKERNNNASSPRLNQHGTTDTKKYSKQSFSGPISSKAVHNSPPQMFSGPLPNPKSQSLSPPKVSPSFSPTFLSSPEISELHELPRPPSSTGYSAPLAFRAQEHSSTSKSTASNAASPLPKPPQALPRSFSIPSRGSRVSVLNVSRPVEAPRRSDMVELVSPPPLILPSLPYVKTLTDSVIGGQATRNAGTE